MSLWPSGGTDQRGAPGLRPNNTSAAGSRVRRHTSTITATSARASIPWKNNRFASSDPPVTLVPTAATTTNAGPYTDGVWRQPTKDRSGSFG